MNSRKKMWSPAFFFFFFSGFISLKKLLLTCVWDLEVKLKTIWNPVNITHSFIADFSHGRRIIQLVHSPLLSTYCVWVCVPHALRVIRTTDLYGVYCLCPHVTEKQVAWGRTSSKWWVRIRTLVICSRAYALMNCAVPYLDMILLLVLEALLL